MSSFGIKVSNLSIKWLKNSGPILKSIGALFGGNIASSLLGAAGGLLIARFVAPDISGQYKTFTIPLLYLAISHLGTFDGLWRLIPFYMGKGNSERIKLLAETAGAWNIFISCFFSIIFVILALFSLIKKDLFGFAGWIAQAICSWGIFYGGYLGATYRTINQFVTFARIQFFQAILAFVLAFLVPQIGFFGLCLRASLPGVVGVILFYRYRPLRDRPKFNRNIMKEIVRTGLPFTFWGSLNSSIWVATESALVLSNGGNKALGVFSIAVTIRDAMSVLPQSVLQVLMPRTVELFAREGNVRDVQKRSIGVTMLLVILMAIAAGCFSVLLDWLIPRAIPKYIDGLPIMKICLWFSVAQAASLPLNTLFAAGKSWLYGRGIVVGFIAFLAASYFFSSLLRGGEGVVLGSLLGRCVRIIVSYYDIKRVGSRNE